MRNRLLMAGIGLLAFGLANFFRYIIAYGRIFWNTPFPFEHIHYAIHYEGRGIHYLVGYMPLDEAANDPYWLFWSMALYAGIVITGFAVWSRR